MSLSRATRLAALLLFLPCAFLAGAARPAQRQAKAVRRDPEEGIRPIRALLALSEEPVKAGSSCDQRRLIAGKPGPQQIGDMLAVLLAYHDSGINSVQASCEKEKDGEASCSVGFRHKKNSQAEEEFAIFKFKVVKGKAQASSLECELSP